MGGLAFAQSGPDGSPLNVPRMPPDIYRREAAKAQAKLRTMFRNVTIPREAPGKVDFGDIDFLVEGALCLWTPATIKIELGATHHIGHGGAHSFAVPYTDSPNEYVQVDVEIAPGSGTQDSADLFEWTRFMKSDADLMQIIGICHRSLGLTCNDRGLHLRVEEIEPYNKKKSLLFLTRNIDETLEFYGLDTFDYWAGFEDEQGLFDWVSKGRFFNREIFESREEKANDRARQRKRPMYSRFVDQYMSSHPEEGIRIRRWTRQEVLDEALSTFNARGEYESMMAEHELRDKDLAIWRRVQECLPVEGNSLGVVLKALRRFVNFSWGQPFITSKPLLTDQPCWGSAVTDEEAVLEWVTQNWEEIKALEKARAAAAKEAGKNKVDTI